MEISTKGNIKKTKNQVKANITGRKDASLKVNSLQISSMVKAELTIKMEDKLKEFGNTAN